ncbi:MAG: UPF0158 family protein [Acidimicrobiales bacterium]|nr:UPF0158 family protein [Acidimicrobiales bacterium]
MSLYEWRKSLRVAVSRRDSVAITELVSSRLPNECLQSVGAALLIPLAADIDAARALSQHCIDALSSRDWDGDAELVSVLESALALDAPSPLKPVPVDLDSLADVLGEGLGEDPGVIDLESGEVWPAFAVEYASDTDDASAPPEPDGVRVLEVAPQGSGGSYRDMRDFIRSVDDPRLADRLSRATDGKGAFRRFRDALDRSPDEMSRWQAFSDDRRLGRARAWLAEQGLRPAQRTGSVDD